MVNLDKVKTGRSIKSLRAKAGMSQENLAVATGINITTISKYETGEIIPGLDKAFLIAKALNCRIDDICELPPPYMRRAAAKIRR